MTSPALVFALKKKAVQEVTWGELQKPERPGEAGLIAIKRVILAIAALLSSAISKDFVSPGRS